MKKTRFVPLIVYLLLLGLAFSFILGIFSTSSNAIPYSGIVSLIEDGKVKNFVVEDQTITMELYEALDGALHGNGRLPRCRRAGGHL